MESHNRNYIYIAVFFVVLLVVSVNVSALNLGTLQKSEFESAVAGENIAFDILFWTGGLEDYNVYFETVKKPFGWTVLYNPSEFHMSNTTYFGKFEHIYLPSIKRTVIASLVNVYVFVPVDAVSGNYTVVSKAVAGGSPSGGVSLKQERLFVFDISVESNNTDVRSQNNDDLKSVVVDINPTIINSNEVSGVGVKRPKFYLNYNLIRNIIISIIVLIILILAWRIYHYD